MTKIYKTKILPAVLYGGRSYSLTLKEEQRQKVFEIRILRRISGLRSSATRNYMMRNFRI
jgi:hypothetical protein